MNRFLVIFALIVAYMPIQSIAAPSSEYWDIWDKSDENSITKLDHSLWQGVLARHLKINEGGVNKVDYKSLLENDRQNLERYIGSLTSVDPLSLNKNEQLAYWINLYNGLTVKVILDHYPTKSILKINISHGFFTFGPWDKKLITVNNTELSLNDIEHRILRPLWNDPRIHYAVNCASIGCPNLRMEPYTAETADTLLTENAITYINHPRGVSVNNGRIRVSTIFKWYKADFGKSDKNILNHIRQYASQDLLDQIEGKNRIVGYKYDWDLNEYKANSS